MGRRTDKNNKGFSLVELIIVIAVMAILAGALAPQLIRYIDRSRRSTDVQNGQSIATAVNVALADESGYRTAVGSYSLNTMMNKAAADLSDFERLVIEHLGRSTPPTPRYNSSANTDFIIIITGDISTGKKVEVYAGARGSLSVDPDNMLYPEVGDNYDN